MRQRGQRIMPQAVWVREVVGVGVGGGGGRFDCSRKGMLWSLLGYTISSRRVTTSTEIKVSFAENPEL